MAKGMFAPCATKRRHTPRKRSIQYAAALRLYHWRLGIPDRPLSRRWRPGVFSRRE